MKIYLLPDAFSDHNSLLGHNLIFLLREFLAWCMPADRVLDPESYLNQKCITKCNQHYLVEFSKNIMSGYLALNIVTHTEALALTPLMKKYIYTHSPDKKDNNNHNNFFWLNGLPDSRWTIKHGFSRIHC